MSSFCNNSPPARQRSEYFPSSQYALFLLNCSSPILLFLSAFFLSRDTIPNLLAELEAH